MIFFFFRCKYSHVLEDDTLYYLETETPIVHYFYGRRMVQLLWYLS